MSKLVVAARMLSDGTTFTAKGRDAWALLEMLKAGANGVTPVDNPAPRWSGYVFRLKRKYGLNIESIQEPHRGQFPGTHARYVLRSPVEIINRSDIAELKAA